MKKFVIFVLIALVILLVVVPAAVKFHLNSQLENLPEYSAQVESASFPFWRGTILLHDLKVAKLNKKLSLPYVEVPTIEMAFSLRGLLRGRLLTRMGILSPIVNLIDGGTQEASQFLLPTLVQERLKNVIPGTVDKIWIRNAEVHFRNFKSNPPVDLYLVHANVDGTNLSEPGNQESLKGNAQAEADVMETGQIYLRAKVDTQKKVPDADLKIDLKNLNLKNLNPALLAYANVSFGGGIAQAEMNAKIRDGHLAGMIRPAPTKVEVGADPSGAKKPNPVLESLLKILMTPFKDKEKGEEAAQIPFQGDFSNVKIDFWTAFKSVVRDAFSKPPAKK